ncbi:hypothetical protein [Xylophilus sp. ASV27]|nr:hypothetical protein [Xylophilus sp. ASV27]
MSSALIITLEMLGVLGVVLAFGFWELYALRRDKKKRPKPGPRDAP